MKRIIVYGVSRIELRQDIEHFLDDDYKVIGYSDSYFKSSGVYDRPFIEPDEISSQEFDYILLAAYEEATRNSMRKSLLAYGIPMEKIIDPMILLQKNAEKCQFDLIGDMRSHYQGEKGLIFGLSYSRKGICKDILKVPFYDCSLPGLDLYYNFQISRYMERQGLLENVKIALLVFPYHYFVYDMSKSPAQYKSGQIFSIWRLDDWHHYQQVPGAINYVESYRMFGRKISEIYCSQWFNIESPMPYQREDGAWELEPTWFAKYEETVIENKRIFLEFCQRLKEVGIHPVLVVPPAYLRGMSQTSLQAFNEKREQFYNIVQEIEEKIGSITMFDYGDRFSRQPEFFRDLTHLNTTGAVEFTELINKEIL
ncbi:hypothetical protein AALB16_13260 [Lachnospiraceae bacterium 62-35]